METTDLKALLSKVLAKKGITVGDVSVSNPLAPGGNFMSVIFYIDAKVRNNSGTNSIKKETADPERVTEKEEELHVIAKVPPAAEDGFQNPVSLNFTFNKEIFFYKEIMSKYQELLDDVSLECDFAARYYGSKDFPTENEASDEPKACILLENLKFSGYFTGDRLKGLELEELKLVIAKVAIFHALGIAVKKLAPATFEKFNKFSRNVFESETNMVDTMIQEALEKFGEDSILQKYVPRILKSMLPFTESYKNVLAEPWVTITHMDFGIHNMMFHKREDKVDDVKFVDFQTYCLGSPTRDLFHLFFTSVNFDSVSLEALDRLTDFYYEHFMVALKVLLKCEESDLTEFSRDQLNKQMAADAPYELSPIILTNKVLLLKPEEVDGDTSKRMTFVTKQTNTACIDRMQKVMLYYDKKQWI